MKNIYLSDNTVVDYIPSADHEAGDVVGVQGTGLIGVCPFGLKSGVAGAIAIRGVFQMNCKASEDWTSGTQLYYDFTNKEITKTASTGTGESAVSNTPFGIAVNAKLATETTAIVVR